MFDPELLNGSRNEASLWLKRSLSPEAVQAKYYAYSEALDILGYVEIAEQLSRSVDSADFERYAEPLAVILALAREPGTYTTQDRKIFNFDEQLNPLYDPADDSPAPDQDPLDGMALVERKSPLFHDLGAVPQNHSQLKLVIQRPEPPNMYTPKRTWTDFEILRESQLHLLGVDSALDETTMYCQSLSRSAFEYFLGEVRRLARIMSTARSIRMMPTVGTLVDELLRPVQSEILVARPRTYIEALSIYRPVIEGLSILDELRGDLTTFLEDLKAEGDVRLLSVLVRPMLKAISSWAHGDLDALIVPSGWSTSDVRKSLKLEVPRFLALPLLEVTGKLALSARELGAAVPRARPLNDVETYPIWLSTCYDANLEVLRGRLKPKLEETWELLSAIYLARDPQMLNFIYECIDQRIDLGDPRASRNIQDAARLVLLDVWPGAPFDISAHMLPSVNIPPVVAPAFNRASLEHHWQEIVHSISTGGMSAVYTQLAKEQVYREVRSSLFEVYVSTLR